MHKPWLLKFAASGVVIAALCCFTPLLVVLLGIIGLSAWVGYLDIVLLPILVFFMGLVLYVLLKKDTMQEESHDKNNDF
ncbi:MAG: mercury resistance system transport protein MerF [Ghiorsea sp.]|nr:mercury resistance system transport protein MerF [Ghiorsea sp.]